MTSYFRRAGQEITRLLQVTANPAAEAARVVGFAKAVGGVSQFFARSPDFARQVSGTACNIFDRPLVAHQYDDEFESTTLNPAWTPTAPLAAGSLNPYSTPSQTYALHTNYRPSWFMIQAGGTITKPITFAGDFFVWIRGSFNQRNVTPVNNDNGVRLDLSTNPYAATNIVTVSLNEQDAGTVQAEFAEVEGGVFTTIGNSRNMFSTNPGAQPIEAVGIQKIGTTYHGWAISRTGAAMWLGSTSFAPTIGSVALTFPSASTAAPGTMICGVDFVRFRDGATFLP